MTSDKFAKPKEFIGHDKHELINKFEKINLSNNSTDKSNL